MATLPQNNTNAQLGGLPPLEGNQQAQANANSGQKGANAGLPPLDTPVSSEPVQNEAEQQSGQALPDLSGSGGADSNGNNQKASQPAANASSVAGETNLLNAVIKKGLVSEANKSQVEQAVTSGQSLEEAIIAAGVSEEDVYRTKAEMFNTEFIDLNAIEIDKATLEKISSNIAKQYNAVAVEDTPAGLKVAMVDPMDIQKTKYISTAVGKDITPVFSSPQMISYVIDNKYGAQVGSEVAEALEDVTDTTSIGNVVDEVTDLSATGNLANAPVSKIVNMILEYAIKYKSSDVHIEPREDKIAVRFRVFGVLSEKLSLPRKLLASVVSRLKILSNLKIDEHRIPQDGRFQVKMGDKAVDLRVSIMPTVYGEKVVMRLLEKGGGAMDLAQTGMRGHAYKIYTQALKKTQGIILVTGPTGSGKTQTLASSLKILNTPEVNIMTLENPVEIRINGINQVQINEEVGLTFAKGLRAFLRQDPDIIMVGEIRDGETAELAVQAALTGHLVLATLHTNSAAGAIPRLIDMGIEPFLLASTLNVVVGQRLVRKLNDECKEAYYADQEIVQEIHKVLDGIKAFNMYDLPNNDAADPEVIEDDKLVLYRGKQDGRCKEREYTGRIGIFEALDVNEEIGKLVLQQASTNDIAKTAVANGMVTMAQDGFMKALEGHTTVEEVLRVQQN
jgi:type IV pilus assembly protein PilB